MKKIILVGEYYSSNLGDGVLCDVVKKIIEEMVTDCKISIFDLSLKSSYQRLQPIKFDLLRKELSYVKYDIEKRFSHLKIGSYQRKIKKEETNFKAQFEKQILTNNTDVIVFAGGQMFNDTFISRIFSIVKIAEKYSIPVIFNACGCANYMSAPLLIELEKILNSSMVKMISVRDGYEIINKLKLKVNVKDTMDTALLTNKYFLFENIKSNFIGLGVMYSKNHSPIKQIKFWNSLITSMIIRKIDFKIFCNGNPYDYGFAQYLLKINSLSETKYLDKNPVTPMDLVEVIASYKLIVSMRLHSLIIAYSEEIPAVAISWDKKVEKFYNKLGRNSYCVNLDCNGDKIYSKIEMLQKNSKTSCNYEIESILYSNVSELISMINNL